MVYFKNNSHNPYFNLAIEEALIKSNIKNDIFLLWQNSDTVVIGRNQNAYEEINIEQVKKDNIGMVRRLSGGGAVFQDLGNICYTFIVNAKNFSGYEKMMQPVIETLNKLGVPAKFTGKNDIKVNGKKISGNAQYRYRNRLLQHGTLLYNVELDRMTKYLKPDNQKLISKGIKSIRSQVVNIKELLPKDYTQNDFINAFLQNLKKTNIEIKSLPKNIIAKAHELVKNKYNTWNWKYGVFPKFQYINKKRFENRGSIEIMANVEKGIIIELKIYGDFIGSYGTEIIETSLVGQKYTKEVINKVFNNNSSIDVTKIFGSGYTNEEIINLILSTLDNPSVKNIKSIK